MAQPHHMWSFWRLASCGLAFAQAGAEHLWGCFAQVDAFLFCCSKQLHLEHFRGHCFGPGGLSNASPAEACCAVDRSQQVYDLLAPSIMNGPSAVWQLDIHAGLLETYLLGHNLLSVIIWELLTHNLVQQGLAAYNAVKDAPPPARASTILAAARQLQRASQVIEMLHHAIVQRESWKSGRVPMDMPPEDPMVWAAFRPFAQLDSEVARLQDALAFGEESRAIAATPPALVLGPSDSQSDRGQAICVVIAVLGRFMQRGSVTLWSLLRHRADDHRGLRLFILGDRDGFADWDEMVQTLLASAKSKEANATVARLAEVRVEKIDITTSPFLGHLMRRLPRGCTLGQGFRLDLYARLLSHEFLPEDVHRCIALDIGDVLLFDDIAGLWDFGDAFGKDDILAAAPHFPSMRKPSLLNGGVVLYNLQQMRERNFTEDSILAARVALAEYGPHACEWDQDIINLLQQHVYATRNGAPQIRQLPCRWSLLPSMEWKVGWNSQGLMPRSMWEHKRYPGILTAEEVEIYCPSSVEMLHFLHAHLEGPTHDRILALVELHGTGLAAAYPDGARAQFTARNCPCGERVALMHVAGSMKHWPWLQRLFAFHAPPGLGHAFKASAGDYQRTTSEHWLRQAQVDRDSMAGPSMIFAHSKGYVSSFKNCATLPLPQDGQFCHVPWAAGTPRPGGRGTALSLAAGVDGLDGVMHLALGTRGSTYGFKGLFLQLGSRSWVLRWTPWGPKLAEEAVPDAFSGAVAVTVELDAPREVLELGLLTDGDVRIPVLAGHLPQEVSQHLVSMGDAIEVLVASGQHVPNPDDSSDARTGGNVLLCTCGARVPPGLGRVPARPRPEWQLCLE